MHRISYDAFIIIFNFNYLDDKISKLLLFLHTTDKIIKSVYEKYSLSTLLVTYDRAS